MQPKHFHEIHPWFQNIYWQYLTVVRLWIMSDHFQAAVDQKQLVRSHLHDFRRLRSLYINRGSCLCVCVFIRAISMCVCVYVCWVYKYPRVSQQSWVWVAGSGYVRSHNGLQWTAWPQIRSTKCDTNSFSLTPRWHCLSPGLSVPLWVCVCVCVWRLLWSYSSLVHTCITSITSLFTFFCPQMWI